MPTAEKVVRKVGDFFYTMNAMMIDKDVTCYVIADTDEPVIYAAEQTIESGAGNWNIQIVPQDASLKILNADDTRNGNMIRFEGADNYTIDGQFNNDGNHWLKFQHERDDQSVFYFFDDAIGNTVENTTIVGAGILNPRGTIFFYHS